MLVALLAFMLVQAEGDRLARTLVGDPASRVATSGVVTTVAGEPIASASVELFAPVIANAGDQVPTDRLTAVTNARGEFSVALLRGREYHGWAFRAVDDRSYQASDIEDAIADGVPIAIRIHGPALARPDLVLRGFEAWRARSPMTVSIAGRELTVDAEGHVALPRLPAQPQLLMLRGSDGCTLLADMFEVRASSWTIPPPVGSTLDLGQAGSLPHRIEILGASAIMPVWTKVAAGVAMDGSMSFVRASDLDSAMGWSMLLARVPGCVDAALRTEAGEQSVDLARGGALRGRLLLAPDQPLARVPVVLRDASEGPAHVTLTALDGSFAIGGRVIGRPALVRAGIDARDLALLAGSRDERLWSEVLLHSGALGDDRGVILVASLHRLTVRVVDEQGSGMARARVTLRDEATLAESDALSAISSPDGLVTLLVPRARSYAVGARSGDRSGVADIEVPASDEVLSCSTVVVTMRAGVAPNATASLAILVKSRDTHRPLARGRVSLFAADGPFRDRLVDGGVGGVGTALHTNAEGRCAFRVPAQTNLLLRVVMEDGSASPLEMPVVGLVSGEHREISIELATEPDRRYCGRVVARADHAPVAGARVRVSDAYVIAGGDAWVEHQRTLADVITAADGSFAVVAPSWRNPNGRIDVDGFAPRLFQVAAGHERDEQAAVFDLERTAAVAVRVRDGAGQPLALVAVRLAVDASLVARAQGEWGGGEPLQWQGVSDADGRCEIESLVPRVPIAISLWRSGTRVPIDLDAVTLVAGERRALDITLEAETTLRGTLLDDHDVPVGNQPMWLVPAAQAARTYFEPYHRRAAIATSTTDAQGRFVMRGLTPGSWWVGPACDLGGIASATAVAPIAEVISIAAGEREIEIVLHTSHGLTIEGRVVDALGKSVANAEIGARNDSLGCWATCDSDDSGAFRVGALVAGRWSLDARAAGGRCTFASVTAQAGDRGIVLVLEQGGAIVARVVDTSGVPTPAVVTVVHVGVGWCGRYGAPNGELHARALQPGEYGLVACTADGRAGVLRGLSVTSGSTTSSPDLVLAGGATLRVRYVGEAPLAQITLRLGGDLVWSQSIGGKDEVRQVLPPGEVTLELSERARDAAPRVRSIKLELDAGVEQEVVLGRP